MKNARILYCRCAHAQVVPNDTKDEVLKKLCESGVAFESVSDLCEMSARRDPRLQTLLADASEEQPVRIAACHHRAVKWLFHAADAPFPEDDSAIEVLNMREQDAEEIVERLKES